MKTFYVIKSEVPYLFSFRRSFKIFKILFKILVKEVVKRELNDDLKWQNSKDYLSTCINLT